MEARFLLGVGIWEDEHPFISSEGYAAALPAHLFFFFISSSQSTLNIETIASYFEGFRDALHILTGFFYGMESQRLSGDTTNHPRSRILLH